MLTLSVSNSFEYLMFPLHVYCLLFHSRLFIQGLCNLSTVALTEGSMHIMI